MIKKSSINDMSDFISDFIFNQNISFKDLDEIYKQAKLKIKKEITELYERVK